jgi:predicted phage terminase large subunit-like protein
MVRNCMLFMPPGSAKSTYASVVFPTWYLGKFPKNQIILASYGSDLAKKHGRKARQICASDAYTNVFDTTIRADTRAADEWALETDSEYMAGGLLSGITGNRADGLIVDDPVKGRQEAESETMRNSTWDAYENDADTRLKPNGWKCLIQTRWHEDDLAGRILPKNWAGESGVIRCRDGQLWVVICIQAECTRPDDPLGRKIGDTLWPEWFIPGHFDRFKRSPRLWRSLFQQVPTADDGDYFRREWFGYYEKAPDNLNVYISQDTAETTDAGDYTWITVWGVCPRKNVYVLNMWRDRVDTLTWVEVLTGNKAEGRIGLFGTYKPQAFIPESDSIFKAAKPFLQERMLKEGQIIYIEEMPHGGKNKPSRASSFQGLASMRRVYLDKNHPLTEEWMDAHLKFPNGAIDDPVDASAAFGRYIYKVWEKHEPEALPPEIKLDRVEIRMSDFEPRKKEW